MPPHNPQTQAIRLAAVASLSLLLLCLAGCRRFYPPVAFNLRSVNVASIPPDWPYEDVKKFKLTEVQEEVLAERGRPDRFRVRWDEREEFIWGPELRQRFHRNSENDIMMWHHHRKAPMPFEVSWIYQEEGQSRYRREADETFRGEEVIFLDEHSYEIVPIDAMLGVLLDNGDPEKIDGPERWRGHELERWRYYQRGRVYHFLDGHLDRVETLPGMPAVINPHI
jgi:hypothetical protein